MTDRHYDIILIGAGVIGCALARVLARTDARVAVLEAECDVGMGASSANSAIVHAGYDPQPGSLKARLNVAGNRIWGAWARELGIAFNRCGSLVVSLPGDNPAALPELLARGRTNGVPGLEIISPARALKLEKDLNPQLTGALYAPSAATIDPFAAVLACAENAAINGTRFYFNTPVESLLLDHGRLTGVTTPDGPFLAPVIINCAGSGSASLTAPGASDEAFTLKPRSGEYAVLDSSLYSTKRVVFPLPTEKGKGILVSSTVHGNTLVGPNSLSADPAEGTPTSRAGLEEILTGGLKLFPALPRKAVIARYAGLRAAAGGDFIISPSQALPGLFYVCGIDSPGLASAPAIADYALEMLKNHGVRLQPRKGYRKGRPLRPHFCHMSQSQRAALVRKHPAYGRIICRCELVTEGEILAELKAPLPPASYDGLKRRLWLGTGRCQGAFDYPRVLEILAREWNTTPETITKNGPGSPVILGVRK